MGKNDKYIVGLDIGSSKTCALVCLLAEGGKLEVAGLGVSESRGWRKGIIVNLDASVASIKKAVEQAEAAAGVPVDSAYVGIAGAHIKGVSSRGGLTLGNRSREISREDLHRVVQTAQSISLPPDREVLHVLPQEYLLDSQNGIRDPVGMIGTRLEANVHLVTASATATQNVVTATNRAGILVLATILEQIASAESNLTPDERELGAALVDIGGGTADLVIYHEGTVRHTAVIPLGGDHFTNDIAVGLRTPIPEAEKMKRKWGLRGDGRTPGEAIEVPSVGERPTRTVAYSTLSEILEPRALELVEMIGSEISRLGLEKQLGAGVVLTGGGAKLTGLSEMAEQMLGMPVRRGLPRGLSKMGETVADPIFSTVVGLVIYGNRLRILRDAHQPGLGSKVLGLLKGRAWSG